ncbi:MAG: Na+/H+ antiporter subunit E [Gammaproteobacteria bacterium]|nr:Na+/H+ antiporter subunit E [Gammaproteobacteria bacterium]
MTRQIQHVTLTFVLAFVFWLLLVGSVTGQEVVAGLLVAAAVAALNADRPPVLAGLRLSPMAPVAFVLYLVTLLRALLRANLDVARRVLTPSLPIRPAMVRVKTSLRSDLGRLVLANSITLTPGTLSVDVDDDAVVVHWIDCAPGTDLEAATRAIAADFERHLRGFLT